MNREQAIKWCEVNLNTWPNNTKCLSPGGWTWKVKNAPYQLPEYILYSDDSEDEQVNFHDTNV